MTRNPAKWFALFIIFCVLSISCAKSGTRMVQQKVTDAYQGQPVSDILVIAVSDQERSRNSFERSFVSQLKAAGLEAISSAEVLPIQGDLKLEKEQILKVVERFDNDAVLITHLADVNIRELEVRSGPASSGYYGYYGFRHASMRDTGYGTTRTTVRLETNLYDAKTEQLIWSGQSESWNIDTQKERFREVIKLVVDSLKANKLIAPK